MFCQHDSALPSLVCHINSGEFGSRQRHITKLLSHLYFCMRDKHNLKYLPSFTKTLKYSNTQRIHHKTHDTTSNFFLLTVGVAVMSRENYVNNVAILTTTAY